MQVEVFFLFISYMCSLYVEYSISAVGQICAMWQTYLFRAYVNNVKCTCMYTSAPGHTVDCSEFIFMQTKMHTFQHMKLYTYKHTCRLMHD